MTSSSKTPQILLALAALLALSGALLSGYLGYSTSTGSGVAGCGGEVFDCDAVLATKWSRWLGLPVSWLGLGCYALMGVGALLALFGKSIGWRLLEACCLMAVGSGVWFVVIQLTTLDSFCLYCLLTHLCGLIATVLMVVARFASGGYEQGPTYVVGLGSQVEPNSRALSAGPPPIGIPSLIASLAIVALVGGQLFSKAETSKQIDVADLPEAFEFEDTPVSDSETANSEPEEAPTDEQVVAEKRDEPNTLPQVPKRKRNGSRKVSLLDGKLTLDAYAYPILGSPEAEHVVVEIMDYTCPHCREFHELLHTAIEEYKGRVAVIVLHSPSELLCNPYIKTSRPRNRGACRAAKLAIGVSMVDPEAFPTIHERMLKGERLSNYTSLLVEAKKLVDSQKLRVTLQDNSGALSARVTKNIKLYASMQSKTSLALPMQIVGDQAYSGKPESLEALYEQWEVSMGIEPPAVEIPF